MLQLCGLVLVNVYTIQCILSFFMSLTENFTLVVLLVVFLCLAITVLALCVLLVNESI